MIKQVRTNRYNPRSYNEGRKKLFNALIGIATEADLEPGPEEGTKKRGLRVGRASATTDKIAWFRTMTYKPYDYRCVLNREVLYDVGDNSTFENSLRYSFALWEALRKAEFQHKKVWEGGSFWGGLSGGRGVHTHVFIDDPDHREPFVSAMNTLWRIELDGEEPDVDRPHLHPRPGTKFVREFGARKRQYQKTLIATPEEQILKKIISRGEAYARVPLELPKHPVPISQPVGGYHYEVRRAFGGKCPVKRRCIVDKICEECPATR